MDLIHPLGARLGLLCFGSDGLDPKGWARLGRQGPEERDEQERGKGRTMKEREEKDEQERGKGRTLEEKEERNEQ